MKHMLFAVIISLFLFSAFLCYGADQNPPIVSKANLGKKIILEGWAVNRKGGAQLIGTNFAVWIEDVVSWPEGFYTGGDRGQKVKVTGILAEDHGLPVFVPKGDELKPQGIPVPKGTDLNKASHRYLLKDATWELIEE